MTREEITICKMYLNDLSKYHNCNEYKLLMQLLEQQPNEDAISRQAMLEYQHCLYGKMPNRENHKLWKFITELPSVTPAHKKCCNINTDYAECDQFICSNCGIELQDWSRVERDEDDGDITYHEYEFNFCPNCGARKENEA